MRQSTKTLLTTVVIVAAFFLFTQLHGDTATNIAFGDHSLTMIAPRQYTYTVEYDDIKALELIQLPEEGTVISGDESRRYSWGERENDTWGRYTLCISKKIDVAVLITTLENEYFVLNYESDDTTTAILQMFNELLADRAETNVSP